MPITTCVFDAYGTLFDVAAAARIVAEEPGREAFKPHWSQIATHWRFKQLQYSWLLSAMQEYTDFWQVTKDGLDWALEAEGLDGDAELRERLLQLYWELEAFPEMPTMMRALKAAGKTTAILSNANQAMLRGAVSSAGVGEVLDDVLSAETIGIFKPSPRVYDMVLVRYGCTRDEVLFVSANGWDIGAAAHYGFQTAWVNRAGDPVDRLPGRPTHQLSDLSGIPALAGA